MLPGKGDPTSTYVTAGIAYYIREKLDAQHTVLDDITRKQLVWYGHVERRNTKRLPKIMINWKPEGRERSEVVPEEPGTMGYIQL